MSLDDDEKQMFGPPPEESVYWTQPGPAQPEQPGQGNQPGREIKVGDKSTLKLEPHAENTILQLPGLAPALLEHGKKLAAIANANAQTPGAQFEAVIIKDANGNPEVIVQSANQEAAYDEHAYSTLTAAMTTAVAQAGDQEQGQ
jgi:hypothetical protein